MENSFIFIALENKIFIQVAKHFDKDFIISLKPI